MSAPESVATPPRRVILVTGSSRGIGAATAKLAAERGYAVAVNYNNNAAAAEAVVAAITEAGGEAVAIQGDMAQEAEVGRVFDRIDATLGRLTHLVYNSGIVGTPSRLEDARTETLREVIDLNVMGAFYAVRAAIPRISRTHGGTGGAIVLISSTSTTRGSPNEYVWYAASKGAIDSMTYGLAKELVPGRDSRQCRRFRPDLHGDSCASGPTRARHPGNPASACRHAPGSRGSDPVPAVGGFRLYDGRHPARQRRTLKL